MARLLSRAGCVLLCAGFLAGFATALQTTRAQSQDPDGPPVPRRQAAKPGGSDVFDDTGEDAGESPPARPPPAPEPDDPEADPSAEPDDSSEPADADSPMPADEPRDPEPVPPPPPPPAKAVPVPGKAAQAKALKLVKEVFAEEYGKKAAADKLALATKFLEQAREPGNDAAAQYVMLSEARGLAAAVGDISTAFAAIERTAEVFAGVDAMAMKLDTLSAASSAKLSDPARAAALVEAHLAVAAELLAAGEIDRAVRIVSQAEPIARRARDADLAAEVGRRKKALKDLVLQFAAQLGPAREKLASHPGDPTANLTMGRFYCFAVGDWQRGLPMLAKGNDAVLRKMARDDLGGAGGAGDALAVLGDAWWQFAEKQRGFMKGPALARAGFWYRQAVQGLAGLQRVRVEKRLEQVGPDDAGGASASASASTDKSLRLLNTILRKLPENARPRKGQGWDVGGTGAWLTEKLRSTPFDAVRRLEYANPGRLNGRDVIYARLEPAGPVTVDGVDYRLYVSLTEDSGVTTEALRKLTGATHVRVSGTIRAVRVNGLRGEGNDFEKVEFWLVLDRPSLTPVATP